MCVATFMVLSFINFCFVMKKLLVLLTFILPSIFAFLPNPNYSSSMAKEDSGPCKDATAEIMSIVIDFSDDCSTYTWSVTICNNHPECGSPAGVVNVLVEYCPFNFNSLCFHFSKLGPNSCTRIVGTGQNDCGNICVSSDIVGSGTTMSECGDGC
jgi:hypothetical protein